MHVVNIEAAGNSAGNTSSKAVPSSGIGEESTRQRVIVLVGEQGPIKASEVAQELGLTGPAVRRHLDALVADGIVVTRDAHHTGRGRPARAYTLSPTNEEQLPSKYDDFALAALRHLAEGNPASQGVASVAQAYVVDVERRVAPKVAAAGPDLTAKVHALAQALTDEGHLASVRPVDGQPNAVQLCQGHCPLRKVAAEFPDICSAEIESFSRMLGVPVRRLATLAHGDHVCTTHIGLLTTTEDLSASLSSPSRKDTR